MRKLKLRECAEYLVVAAAVFVALSAVTRGQVPDKETERPSPSVTHIDGRDIHEVIASVPPYSVVACDRNSPLTLSEPIVIEKPLTVRGINAHLPDKLGKTPLIVVLADSVTITDFELHGNADSVTQKERAPLMAINGSDFTVERGLFVNSSKDGVAIYPSDSGRDITGGVVRDIVGKGVVRDVVSISGGSRGGKVRNVLVENVRGYNSSMRGAVEVSDGSDNITVRKVYAEQSLYAIDVQDHGKEKQVNSNTVIEDVNAVKCTHAIRTANHPFGHTNLSIRNVTAERCSRPIQISNTGNVILDGVRIIDHTSNGVPVAISNCDGVNVRNVIVTNSDYSGTAVCIENCNNAHIDGVVLQGEARGLTTGITYLLTTGKTYSGLCIRNVIAPNMDRAGILLTTAKKGGMLTDFIVSGNLARVIDEIHGKNGIISGNLSDAGAW